MPKIIENLRERLLAEAKRQIVANGYADTTVRSVASACGVGVGTVYNYFPSKEMLIAGFVAEDWQAQLETIAALPPKDPEVLCRGIYEALRGFAQDNRALFSDADAAKVISLSFAARHQLLRGQIAGFVRPLCDADFTAVFIAESLISWAMEETSFDTVWGVVQHLFLK